MEIPKKTSSDSSDEAKDFSVFSLTFYKQAQSKQKGIYARSTYRD